MAGVYTSAAEVFDGVIAAVHDLNGDLERSSDWDAFQLRSDDGEDSVEQVPRDRSWQLVPLDGPSLGPDRCTESMVVAPGFLHLDRPESLRRMLRDHALVRPRLRALARHVPGVIDVKVEGPRYGYDAVPGMCLVSYRVSLTYHVRLVQP